MLGILIINTGTPDAPTLEAIKPYLKQFLSDRNLINVPPVIWKPILNCCILPNRPKKTLPVYQEFWTPEGSPFMLTSIEQRDKLDARMKDMLAEPTHVQLAMRYGNPSIESGIQQLLDLGADRIVVLPLYPQNNIACAGTCFEEFDRCYDRVPEPKPPVIKVKQYWDAPGYLDVLASSVRAAWNYTPGAKLLVSFHSIPMVHARAGDTYPASTSTTTTTLADKLGIAPEDAMVVYQSRFDNRKWLGPMLVPTLEQLAREGVRDVAVVCPGFSVDCTETIHEVQGGAGGAFLRAAEESGGEPARFTYVPALGADDALIEVLAHVIAAAAS